MPVLNASPIVHVLFQMSITTDNVSPAAPDSVCTCAWSGLTHQAGPGTCCQLSQCPTLAEL